MTSANILSSSLPAQSQSLHEARTLKSDETFLTEKAKGSHLKTSPQDRYLSLLQRTDPPLINETLQPTEAVNEKEMPPLDKETLIQIVHLLSGDIIVKARDGRSFNDFTFSLKELYAYLEERFEKELGLKIDEAQIVGGMVFWLLKNTYLSEALAELGIEDPKEFLTEALMAEFGSTPSDTDFRFIFPNATKQHLKHQKRMVEDFFVEKLHKIETGVCKDELKRRVHENAFLKRNTQYDKENCYSTVSVGDPESSRNFDLLFIKKLQREGLFLKDMQLNISPLIQALKECGWNSGELIEKIRSDAICLRIIPESPFFRKAWSPLLVDCPALLIRAAGWDEINHAGWPALISASAKGKVCLQPGLNESLWKTFCAGNIQFLLAPRKRKKGSHRPSYQEQIESRVLREFYSAISRFTPALSQDVVSQFKEMFLPKFRSLEAAYLSTAPAKRDSMRPKLQEDLSTELNLFLDTHVPEQQNSSLASSVKQQIREAVSGAFNEALTKQEESLAKTPAFWLTKTAKNHHKDDPLALFALTLNACLVLENADEAAVLWKTMAPAFQNLENPLIKEIHCLLESDAPFKEISALLQAKAFLHLNTSKKDPHFSASMCMPADEPFLKINLGGVFLTIPFSPEEAFQSISKTENPQSLAFISDHLYPNASYIAGDPLPIPTGRLMKIGISLLSSNPALGSALIVACSVNAKDGKAFNLLIDSIPKFLQHTHLMESLSSLPLQNKAAELLGAYNELSKMHGDNNKLKWAHALITSDDDALVKKGYDLLVEQMPIAKDLLLAIIKDLARSRPDLALTLIARASPEDIVPSESLSIWVGICSSYRRKLYQSKELLLLFHTFEILSAKNSDRLPHEVLESLCWLNKELLENGHIEESIRLLQFIKSKNIALSSMLSWGSLPEDSKLKVRSLGLIQKLLSDMGSGIEERLTLAMALLSDSAFSSNFSVEELRGFKFRVKEAVKSADAEGYAKELSRYLKFLLEKWEEDNDAFTLAVGAVLKHLLRIKRQQPLSQFLNELLENNLQEILQQLLEKDRSKEAIKILKNASLAHPSNRMAWFKARASDLLGPSTYVIVQEAALAAASHILQNNPNEQELLAIIAVYESLSPIPFLNWSMIFTAGASYPSEAVRSKIFDLLSSPFAENTLSSMDAAERAELWLLCIQGFKKFSDPKILDLFKRTALFCEAFSKPVMEDKRYEALKLSFACLRSIVKAKQMPAQSHDAIQYFREQLKDSLPEDLRHFTDISAAECLADSGKPELLAEACKILESKIEEGKIDAHLEDALIFVIDALCRQEKIEGSLLEQSNRLLKTIRMRSSSLKTLPAVLSKLGRHRDAHFVLEACSIFQHVKENSAQKDFEHAWNVKELSSAASYLLENVLKDHFEAAGPFLCNLFSDLQWAAAFNIPSLPMYLADFLKQRTLRFTKDTPLAELTEHHLCLKNNLSILMRGGQIEDALVQRAIDLICLLEIKDKAFHEDLALELFAGIADLRKTFLASKLRKRNSAKKKQSAGGSASVPQVNDFEAKINNWKIYFLKKTMGQGFNDTQLKKAFIDSADQTIRELFRTKNKDSVLFAEFLKKYLFLSFNPDETELFQSYRKMTKATLEDGLKESYIDPKEAWMAACALHFEIDAAFRISPPKKEAIQSFEAMAEGLLAQETLESIKECLFMLQEGRTALLGHFPETLERLYKLALRKAKKIKASDEECLKLLELMQRGIFFEHPHKQPPNPLIAKGKTAEWQAASRSICSDFIRTLFTVGGLSKDAGQHLEMKLQIAQDHLSKALRQHCFEGNYVAYMRALEQLMDETAKVDDSELFKKSSSKIYALMLIPNTQNSVTKKEKEQRALTFIYWLKLLAASGCSEKVSTGKDQLLKAKQGPPPKIFDGLPKMLNSAEALFPQPKESKKESRQSKPGLITGLASASIPASLAPSSPEDALSQITLNPFTKSSLNLLESYFDFYYQKDDIKNAVELLKRFLNSNFLLNPSLQGSIDLHFITWIIVLFDHKMGGVEPAFSLWEEMEKKGVWNIQLSATHAALLEKLADATILDPARFEKLICLSKKYKAYESSPAYMNMILVYIEALMRGKRYREVHYKINRDWTCCFSEENLFTLRLNLAKELIQINCYFESVEQLCYLFDSQKISSQLSAELNQIVFSALKYLLDGSYTYIEHRAKLKAAHCILSHPFYQQFSAANPAEAFEFQSAFVMQAHCFEELKKEASSVLRPQIGKSLDAHAEQVFKELKRELNAETLDAAALKVILKDLIFLEDEDVDSLLVGFVKKALQEGRDKAWRGSKEDICICMLYAIKKLHAHRKLSVFILNNALIFLEYFDEDELFSYKLDALISIFEAIEGILENAENDQAAIYAFILLSALGANYLGEKEKEISSRGNGSDALMEKILLAHNAGTLALVSLSIKNGGAKGVSNALVALHKMRHSTIRDYHLNKIYSQLIVILNSCKSADQAEAIPLIQHISKEARAKGSLHVDYFPCIQAFYTFENPLLNKEACALLLMEIMKQEEDFFLSAAYILNRLIQTRLESCYQEIGDCLLQLNRTVWGGNEETARLWDAYIQGSLNVRRSSTRSFIPLLASLNGVYGHPDISKRAVGSCFTILIDTFNEDLDLYRLFHQAFFLRISHHYLLKMEAPHGITADQILDANIFNFDFNAEPSEAAESYVNESRETCLSLDAIAARNVLATKYFLALLKDQKKNLESKEFGPKGSKQTALNRQKELKRIELLLGLAKGLILKLLEFPDAESFPGNADLFMELLTDFILHPFPSYASSQYLGHLKSCEEIARAARNKGLFKNYPKFFFRFKMIYPGLEYKRSIAKLNEEEEKTALFELLNRLLGTPVHTSLGLAMSLIQDRKPEILTANPRFLLHCYRTVIKGLESSQYKPEDAHTPFIEILANHALELHVSPDDTPQLHARAAMRRAKPASILEYERADAAKKGSLMKASTNQLLQPKKSKEWKKYSSKICKALFFALCRDEEANENFAAKPDFSAACQFLSDAIQKGQFEGSSSSYLKCLNQLLNYTFVLLEYPKVDFTAYCSQVVALAGTDGPTREDLGVKMETLSQWIRKALASKGSPAYRDFATTLLAVLKKDSFAGAFSELFEEAEICLPDGNQNPTQPLVNVEIIKGGSVYAQSMIERVRTDSSFIPLSSFTLPHAMSGSNSQSLVISALAPAAVGDSTTLSFRFSSIQGAAGNGPPSTDEPANNAPPGRNIPKSNRRKKRSKK